MNDRSRQRHANFQTAELAFSRSHHPVWLPQPEMASPPVGDQGRVGFNSAVDTTRTSSQVPVVSQIDAKTGRTSANACGTLLTPLVLAEPAAVSTPSPEAAANLLCVQCREVPGFGHHRLCGHCWCDQHGEDYYQLQQEDKES